jgi:acetate kinase
MPAVLVLNAGSSSLKYALFGEGTPPARLLAGKTERISNPDSALEPILKQVAAAGPKLSAVGHRIVHGGPKYVAPIRITPDVLAELRRISPFDPEHLPAEIALIEAVSKSLPDLTQVACFDTAFHADLPEVSRILPIPASYDTLGIRRYGFHGLSYASVVDELRREGLRGRMILAHLGSGASLAAVLDGKSIDTTMAFTPASGIPMSRRSGDLDPGLYPYLARTEGMTAEQWNRMVNSQSGILGICGSADVRELLEFKGEDPSIELALRMFCYHIRKAIGSLAAALGGMDVLAFSGGIGENASGIRSRICEDLGFLGITLDPERNTKNEPTLSADGARVQVRLVRTDEEFQIARSTREILGK